MLEGERCRYIPLTKGQYATVDARNYSIISNFNWCAIRCVYKGRVRWYAAMHMPGERKFVFMHNLVCAKKYASNEIDHKNRNGLDNRESNLRNATLSQNRANCSKKRHNKSGFVGVLKKPNQPCRPYTARISPSWLNGKQIIILLGSYKTSTEAAMIYDAAARVIRGRFAYQNFPDKKITLPDNIKNKIKRYGYS